MQGRLVRRTQSVGLALGAALLAADCAGPTAPAGGGPGQRRASPRSTAPMSRSPRSRTRPSPIMGLSRTIRRRARPGPSSTSTTTAGLAIRPAWRNPLGGPDLQRPQRAARRAAVVRSRPAGRDHRVLPRQHGDAVARRHRPAADRAPARRLRASTPCWSRRNSRSTRTISSAGRFWSPGGFAAFLSEAQTKLGELYPNARGAFRRMPVVIVAYSGGYLPAVYSLAVGGDQGRIRGVVLLDALYGERDKFVRWVEGPGRNAFFVSAYSTSSREGNEAIRGRARGRWRSDRERPACRAHPGRRRLRRRRLGRPQRLRHLGLWRRAASRHHFPHRRVGGRGGVARRRPANRLSKPGQMDPNPAKSGQAPPKKIKGKRLHWLGFACPK